MTDAGVTVKSPIAGIAMGMLLGDRDSISDDADAMDFKVAGDAKGITAFGWSRRGSGRSTSSGIWRRRWRGRAPS